MHGISMKITVLTEQKNQIKEKILKKHQVKIIKQLINLDEEDEKWKRAEERKKKEQEEKILKLKEEERKKLNEVRKRKIERAYSPAKLSPEKMERARTPHIRAPKFDVPVVREASSALVARRKTKFKQEFMKNKLKENHFHMMYNRTMRNFFDMEEVRIQAKYEKEVKEMENATFAPKLNEKSMKIASNFSPFMERVFDDLEQERVKMLNERSKSYTKAKTPNASSSEFKLGNKEYQQHLYYKNMDWINDRERDLGHIREAQRDPSLEEVRAKPDALGKVSRRLAKKVLASSCSITRRTTLTRWYMISSTIRETRTKRTGKYWPRRWTKPRCLSSRSSTRRRTTLKGSTGGSGWLTEGTLAAAARKS